MNQNQQQLYLQQSGYSFNEQMLANASTRECDRFIPQRSHNRNCHPDALLSSGNFSPESSYSHLIKKRLFQHQNGKVITFNEKEKEEFEFHSEASSTYFKELHPNVESPAKILDIPKFRDDFYLNNIDWSSRGPLAIALDNEIFLYTPESLIEIGKAPFSSYVSGLKISDCIMAVGLSNGMIDIYDLEKSCLVRTLKNHENRVSAFAFVDDLLVSGSKDRSILVHDLRLFSNQIRSFNDHKGEICTLKTKNSSERIFASGSSDGSAIIWDINHGKISQLKGHKGAVKALDWCPWKNGLLATGGGNNSQKYIKIWNTSSSRMVACQPIESQVSGLLWNEELRMLTSSHGYCKNEINFWTMETNHAAACRLTNQKTFKGHERRILNMVQSPDSNYLCTVGADENLKFWCLRSSQSNPFKHQQKVQHDNQFIRI